jgi:hypothetical protein
MFETFHKYDPTPSTTKPEITSETDLRSEPRQKCFKSGQIILGEVGPIYDCIFTDLSWYGVRLNLNGFVPLPNKFKLVLNFGDNRRAIECRPIWSNGNEVGVIFDQETTIN